MTASTYFRGVSRLTDEATGETFEAQTVVKAIGGDTGFHKIWLHEILSLVDEVGNAKMRVLMWLLSNADGQNRIAATFTEIAEATESSVSSVQRLMRSLEKANVIAEIRRSMWRLNPDVIFKGDSDRRRSILIRYADESQRDLFEPGPPATSHNVHPLRPKAKPKKDSDVLERTGKKHAL